ncbi:saccharopine dehydrogenase NADP-binding domain-containing protein [Oceanospirillum sediminis]|uniref:Saccharopine dehydrogenase NADP-binding domain-containing protein n=1 Tax=Oceanospirillum sediminis TaxID=2760088 RepID=A0A839IM33_9GAMM|nr:saccharopine dehydrogenase NADP-binding domain-containing protein [Oceanospirillum sediminis]MBB1485770.1 saccharopine dehydrogenase NADP-binding domain-containing protein [Oceanospirillum sediminis]
MSSVPVYQKKIIVIGGSGETGRRVVHHLSHTWPDARITSAARRVQPSLLSADNIDTVRLDVNDRQKAIDILQDYDLAIITLGPMEHLGSQVHTLCLQAGIDCIDINDSLSATDQILALHEQASQQKQSIFTGMGFTPGLSTLLLMQLAWKNTSPSGHYHVRACMGAAYGGGETSPYAILSSFSNTLTCFEKGQRIEKATPWQDQNKDFHFPGQDKPSELVPFSALESAGLAAAHCPTEDRIKTLDCRYAIQFMSQGMARFMANRNFGEKIQNFLAKKFYTSGQSMKQKKNADPDTTLWVYPDGAPEQGLLIHGVISSYDFTALMACSIADCWLQGKLSQYEGVYGIEHLQPDAHQHIRQALEKRGISSRTPDIQALHDDGIYFGWVEPVCGDVAQLRNYGRNWYTIDKAHPKMVPLQKTFLLESDIWQALKSATNTLSFAGFVAKVMLRWRAHNKQLESYREAHKNSAPELAAIWKRATQDISMFTSGYSSARDLLGQETAFKLYRKMFLETGCMETRCLWPEPEIFQAFDNPAEAVKDYWLSFVKGYADIEVLTLTIDDTPATSSEEHVFLSCEIKDCAYASMFIKLGCPELGNLVREMEQEALEHMARGTGLQVDWTQYDKGEATVRLLASAPVTQHIGSEENTEAQPEIA